MEEFQEADVLWPDAHHPDCQYRHNSHADHPHRQPRTSTAHHQRQSAPVRIPAPPPAEKAPLSTSRRSLLARGYDDDVIDDVDADDDGVIVRSCASGGEAAIVPPHVLAARRCAAERRAVASSVCVGHGRTLKGRDLRAVRNAVLRMTGFLRASDDHQ